MTESLDQRRRKMRRRHAMSPTSIEAMRLRGFCEILRYSGTRSEIDIDSSSSESETHHYKVGDNRKPLCFGAPSA